MLQRRNLVARAQRLLPRQIDITGLLPVVSCDDWGSSPLAALPWGRPAIGLMPLCMHARTAAGLVSQGLGFLDRARQARAPLPGASCAECYLPWKIMAAGVTLPIGAHERVMARSMRSRELPAFVTSSTDREHWLWLLPALGEVWLGWCERGTSDCAGEQPDSGFAECWPTTS